MQSSAKEQVFLQRGRNPPRSMKGKSLYRKVLCIGKALRSLLSYTLLYECRGNLVRIYVLYLIFPSDTRGYISAFVFCILRKRSCHAICPAFGVQLLSCSILFRNNPFYSKYSIGFTGAPSFSSWK